MNKNMYVDVTEVCDDWGVSRAQGYKIIKQLNDRMLAINPESYRFVWQGKPKVLRGKLLWHGKTSIKRPFSGKRRSITHGRLNEYLHEIDEECYEMRDRLVEQMEEKQGVTEKLKAENQMMWVGKMNNIIACAEEIVVRKVVYV
ncbi:MAG: TnpV protein [Ruminococcus sp.]